MALATKVVVGTVSLGSVSVGGWGISEFVKSIAPEVKSLKNESGSSLEATKVGGIDSNKTLLASAKDNSNENWWEWSYKYRFEDKNKWHTHFQSVNKGWSATADSTENNQTALNQACAKAYEKEKTTFTSDTATPTLKFSIEKLCMIEIGKQLTTS